MITAVERTLTVLLALLLSAAFLVWPAQAEDRPPVATIGASQTGSLHVIKDVGDPLTQYGDPSNPNVDTNREPIPGLDFEIRRVETIDLTTNQGWIEASELSLGQFVPGGLRENELGDTRIATTDGEGIAHFNELPVGLYYVSENETSAQSRNLSVLTPFFVTVPTTSADRSSWDYDVVVKAKDQKLQTNKSVDAECVRPGDTFTYAVTGTTPAPNAHGEITRFEIADPLDDVTAYNEESLRVFITDYHDVVETTELNDDDFDVSYENNVLHVLLRESGLRKLSEARYGNPGVSISITFDVTATTDVSSTIATNQAFTLVEGYPEFDLENTPGVPSNETRIQIKDCDQPTTKVKRPIHGKPRTPSVSSPSDKPTELPADIPVPPHSSDYPTQPAPGDQRETPQSSTQEPARSGLASTGAQIIALVLAGAVLVLVGLLLTRRQGGK